jgi:hypothetical protein
MKEGNFMSKGIRTNWDLIPTQTQSDFASCHQPYAYDNNQSHRVKSGSAGSFMDKTQVRKKVLKGNSIHGGQRIFEDKLSRDYITAMDCHAPVYENPPDRVFRNGQWVLITDLNDAIWAQKRKERRAKKKQCRK